MQPQEIPPYHKYTLYGRKGKDVTEDDRGAAWFVITGKYIKKIKHEWNN